MTFAGPQMRQFFETVRRQPKVTEAIVSDPAMRAHFDAIEYGMQRTYELGGESPLWQARFDDLVHIVGRTDLSIKERLLEIGEAFKSWQAADAKAKLN